MTNPMQEFPSPEQIKSAIPLPSHVKQWIEHSRSKVKNIFTKKDHRLVMVVGPCSIHNKESAFEYARKLKSLSEDIKDTCHLIMRAYVEKPRTSIGWKGLVYDPDLDGSNDIISGLQQARLLLLKLAELKVPTAIEFLDPFAAHYYDDLVSWGFIGARTSSSQIHRQLASSYDFPFGIKNTVEGCINTPIQGIISARQSHTFLAVTKSGRVGKFSSQGNPYTHLVLRGSNLGTNYEESHIKDAFSKLQTYELPDRILIDCAHGNCNKDFTRQKTAFFSVVEQLEQYPSCIMGIMLESYLKSGNQPLIPEEKQPDGDISITDACIDWDTTETMLRWAHLSLSRRLASKA